MAMKIIAFEELRTAFWDASFILVQHYADCIEFYHAFTFDFNESMFQRAWEKLHKARKFINSVKPEYNVGQPRLIVDRLSELISESFCRLTVLSSNGSTTCPRLGNLKDHDFLF